MFTNAHDFTAKVSDHAGCSFERAASAVCAVLTGIGGWLGPAQRELLAEELPPGLRDLLAGDGLATPLEERLLAADLALGQVHELLASVGRALADDLSTQAADALREAAPAFAPFLVASSEAQRSTPADDHHLAGGRPGSRHPLAEAAATRAQGNTVAVENPHGDTKLSSRTGTPRTSLSERRPRSR